ncbi:MAG: trigger factor [Chloroflexi bacterium]|nr:trigger factor [Chloroflexota bacterium]
MKVKENKTENNQAILTIEASAEEMEEYKCKAYKKLVKKLNIPGFRKGKAPRNILEKYLGQGGFTEEALEELLPSLCNLAIEKEKLEVYAQPSVEVMQNEPLVFKAVVPLPPTVTLGSYKDIRMKPKKITVKEAEFKEVLEEVRHQKSSWEPVERPVKMNDLVILDVAGTVNDKEYAVHKGVQYPVRKDSIYPAPNFAEQVIGAEVEKEKEFKVTFPEDDHRKDLKGKEATFKVIVHEIKEEKLPKLDDEFARSMEPSITTVAELKKKVKENMKLRLEEKEQNDFENRVVEAVIKGSKVSFPPLLVEVEVEQMLRQQLQRWQMTARSKEEIEKKLEQSPIEEMKKNYQPIAERRVAQSLVLGRVAEAEEIKASEEEINEEIKKVLEQATENKEEQAQQLNTPQSRQQLRLRIMTDKTVDKLIEYAKKPTKKAATTKVTAKAPTKAVVKKKKAKEIE